MTQDAIRETIGRLRAEVKGEMSAIDTSTISGWVAPGWEGVRDAFRRNFDKGDEIGSAFSAYHRGKKVVDLWGGIADPGSSRAWEEDTMVLVYSSTKGVTAMCANRLADEGVLDVDAPVREYWPEFAQAGKEQITVSDLLSHRAGLAWMDVEMSEEDMLSWEPVIRALEAQAPLWVPRTAHGYHATTYGWLVGEVVRRVCGRTPGQYLSEEIAGPLEADFFIGLPASEQDRVAQLVPFSTSSLSPGFNADPAGEETSMGDVLTRVFGDDSPLAKALLSPRGAFGRDSLWFEPRLHQAEIPAANGIGDARSLARLYSACISDVTNSSETPYRLISPMALDRAIHQETEGPDLVLLGLDIEWGLGFMLNRGSIASSNIAGPRSFGHFGMGGSLGWADPDSELAVAYVMNKMGVGTTGDSRGFRLMRASFEACKKL